MDYASIEVLLSTSAEDYFDGYVQNLRIKNKILFWLRYASDEILEISRQYHPGPIKDEKVLISDIILIPARTIYRYRCMGRLTVKAMNSALGINGLSLDMRPNQVAALFQNENQNSDIDNMEKVAELTKSLIHEKEDGTLCINLGKEILSGYECTLNFRKL